MAESLGTLVDKLIVVNIKDWMAEDTRRDLTLPDAVRLKAADEVVVLNNQRNALMQEIDELFAAVIEEHKPVPIHRKLPNYKGGV